MELGLLSLAENKVLSAIENISQSDEEVAKFAQKTHVEVRQLLELSDIQRGVYEHLKGLQLRLKVIRNIKMNWPIWQQQNTHINIRLNQWQGLEQLVRFLEDDNYEFDAGYDVEKANDDNPLVGHYIQPTGAGKTGLFAIQTALAHVKTLVLVPFDNLMYQTEKDFKSVGGIQSENIGVLARGADKELYKRRALITTYGGHLSRMKRDEDYRNMVQQECELVLCDEGHMALGAVTQEMISAIDELAEEEMTQEEREAEKEVLEGNGKFMPSKAIKIAFTATPKLSAKHIRQKFGRCIGRVYQAELVRLGVNVPYKIIHTDGTIEEDDHIVDRMTEEEEIKILHREGVYKKLLTEYAAALATYRSMKKGSSAEQEMPVYGMGFCTNHEECEEFLADADSLGLKFELLTGRELKRGEKGRDQLKDAEARLLKHEIDGFVTVEKLATGYSPDFINTILWARVTSSAKTVQGIGRGGRSHMYPGGIRKTDCTVIETNWTLTKKAKRRKKIPLRLADALSDQGEDAEAICGMANGSKLDIRNNSKFEERERIRELIKNQFIPKTWTEISGVKRLKIKIDVYGLAALSTLFEVKSGATDREAFIQLGKAIWGDEWIDPAEEKREIVRQLLKAQYTPASWKEMDRPGRSGFTIDGLRLSATAKLFNIEGDPVKKRDVHEELGKVIWSDEWIDPDEIKREKLRRKIMEIYTPETWIEIGSKRSGLRIENKGLEAIASIFGLHGDPTRQMIHHKELGRAIWGDNPVFESKEAGVRKDLIANLIKSNYEPNTWVKMKTSDMHAFKVDGLGISAVMTLFEIEDPAISRQKLIELGKAIWQKEWNDPEGENKERIRAFIKNTWTPRSWMGITMRERKKIAFEGMGLAALTTLFEVDWDTNYTVEVHNKLGQIIWGDEWKDPLTEDREKALNFIRSHYTVDSWINLGSENNGLKIEGYGLYALATLFGVKGDAVYKEVRQEIAKLIWPEARE